MTRELACWRGCWLLPVLAACGMAAAQGAPAVKPLLDPAVARLADGVERKNASLQAAEAYLPVLFPSSHASNLYELKNGDVLCVWFSGTWEGSSGVGIVLARRPHGSRNWTQPMLIDRAEGYSYQNPVLFEEPDGTLDLYHSVQEADAGEANAHVLHLQSKDKGASWSKPELPFGKPGAFPRNPLVTLKDGSWLLPLYYMNGAGSGKDAKTNFSAVEISRDRGASWKECMMAGSEGKVQPSVVELAPDRLAAFFRDRASGYVYRSDSADGCAWSPAQATVLPNNNASIQVFRLSGSHLAMVFDNSSKRSGGQRKPLAIALSLDGGETWPYVRDIEEGRAGYGGAEQSARTPGREEYSYPSVIQTRGGEILVAFTYRRQTIKVVSINEEWIRKGGTTGEFKEQRWQPAVKVQVR